MASQVVLLEGQEGKCCGMGWGGTEMSDLRSSCDTDIAYETAAVDHQNLNLSQGKSW